MLRWGVLSTAKIATNHVIPAILLADNGILSAIASRSEDKARQVAEKFAIPNVFTSYEALLESDSVDAVYIPLPTSHHAEWAIKASDAGKHVLCEKPIALQANQIDAIIAARDRNKVVISEAFMVTYHPQWHKVRSLIESGAVGDLQHVHGVFTYYTVDPANMRNNIALGGGALPDVGVYPIVTTRFATASEPLAVSANIKRDPTFGTDIYASCRVDFGSFDLSMYVSTQMALRQSMTFHGSKGCIEVQAPFNPAVYDDGAITMHNANHTEAQSFRYSNVNQYCLQVEAFARAVTQNDATADVYSLESSKNNQKLIDATYKAGESGLWESV